LAKIIGVRLCAYYQREYGDTFISAMPTNVWGVGDSYDLHNSHVLPGMMRRIYEARGKDKVTLWGTGTPVREFLFSDDLARACLGLMENYSNPLTVNIGGDAVRLRELAQKIAEVQRFEGRIEWDHSKPDGTPERILDQWFLNHIGFKRNTSLQDGIRIAFNDFLQQRASGKWR
jgi:GDP-L-fucose synthase